MKITDLISKVKRKKEKSSNVPPKEEKFDREKAVDEFLRKYGDVKNAPSSWNHFD